MALTAKNKIYIALCFWLILCAAMFNYGFKILDQANAQAVQNVVSQRSQLSSLQAELDSFKQAQKDLDALRSKNIKPENFFSKDITLVNELEVLEGLSQKYNVQMNISGLSGTVDAAPRAGTKGNISMETATIGITGSLADVLNFIESIENTSFITNISAITINAMTGNKVNVNLQTHFYLQQNNPSAP